MWADMNILQAKKHQIKIKLDQIFFFWWNQDTGYFAFFVLYTFMGIRMNYDPIFVKL